MPLSCNLPSGYGLESDSILNWKEEISMPIGLRRFPAEWEKQSGVLMALPHAETDWRDILEEVWECYRNIAKSIIIDEKLIIVAPDIEKAKIVFADIDQRNIIYYAIDTNDTWARDFGGITVWDDEEPCILDFKFNAWGLKFAANYDNLITSTLHILGAFNAKYSNNLDFVLEGGSIETDGKGTILTTSECLLSKNRNGAMRKEEIERRLIDSLGVMRVLWLDNGAINGDDTDSHIDTLARFAPDNTIVYVGCNDKNDVDYEELNRMEHQLTSFSTIKGEPYRLLKLPSPTPIFDNEGHRLPATYANFLITNNQVLVPTYSQKDNDNMACSIIQSAFPNHKIVGIDCNALIKQHGSLHCVTMQFPKTVIK